MATGGIINALGQVFRFARGGFPNRGTLFAAGEAGPEIIGNINGRTEVLNKSQIAGAIYSAVTAAMARAINGISFRMPAMATGSVLPYDVAAQVAATGEDIMGTLDANNEALIRAIMSAMSAQTASIVAAINGASRNGGGLNADAIISQINDRARIMGASPLLGV